MSEIPPVLAADNLHKTFREGEWETEVLRGVSLQLQPGETKAVIGSSGSGKSTLLHLLGGLDQPTSGAVYLKGAPFSHQKETVRSRLRNRHIGFVYQFHHLLPELTAEENVMMPLMIRRAPPGEARKAAHILLKAVGLAHRMDHKPLNSTEESVNGWLWPVP